MPAKQRAITIRSADGNDLGSGPGRVDVGDATVWWDGPNGEEEYIFRDVAVWVADRTLGPAPDGSQSFFVTWTDDTDRSPRKDEPAGVVHTVERELPDDGPGGGGVGPFVVAVE